MDKKYINRALFGAGLLGTIGSGIVAAVCTYKAYPQIQEAKENGASKKEIAKIIAKNYIPAFGVVSGTSALMVASQFLGEKKIKELETKVSKIYKKYEKVSGWYKNEHDAIKNVLPEKQQKLLEEKIKDAQAKEYEITDATKYSMFRDSITGVIFESTEQTIIQAVNETINKNLVVSEYATFEDLYPYLALEVPDDFRDFGWSVKTAINQMCIPWVDVKFIEETGEDGTKYKEIHYMSESSKGTECTFDASEDPTDEGWN